MEQYQKKVIKEKKELDAKLEKLDSFLLTPLAKSLPKIDFELMEKQRSIMFRYSILLGARIQRWI